MSDKNQLNTKLNITWTLIINVITQCAYSENVMPIEVHLLGYVVPLQTSLFELTHNSTLNSHYNYY